MNFKKILSLLCTVTMLFSSTFCCKAVDQYLSNIVFLGETKSGKTQICNRLLGKKYREESTPTVGIEFLNGLKISNTKYRIWDAAGMIRFTLIVQAYIEISNSKLGVFVCDLSKLKTEYNFEYWFNIYKKKSGNENIILVGNKYWLEINQI